MKAGLAASDGTIVSSATQVLNDVAPHATVNWSVSGSTDPSLEGAGVQCGAAVIAAPSTTAVIEVMLALLLVGVVIVYASFYALFRKAGHPSPWHGLVPIYNVFELCKLCGVPIAWAGLVIVPWVNIAAAIMIGLGVARAYGKRPGFGVGLGLLGVVFYPVLAFGQASLGRQPGGGGGGGATWAPPVGSPVGGPGWAPTSASGGAPPASTRQPSRGAPGSFSYRPNPADKR